MSLWCWLFPDSEDYRDQAFRDRVKALQADVKPPVQLYGVKGGLSRWERERRKQRSLLEFQQRKRA